MLACLSVTLCMKGATVRSSRRVWLAGSGALAATMIAVAWLATSASGGVQPPPRASMAALGTSITATSAAALAASTYASSTAAVAAGSSTPSAALPADDPGASSAAVPANVSSAPSAAAPANGTATASPAVLPALPGPMVALGDSYTAGALLPSDLRARPLGCLRSTRAYPVLVATALGASLTDAACSSAGVADMTAAQRTDLGTNQPQLGALAPDDSVVMLTLSGDDIGFQNVLDECMELSFTDPWGSPCRAHYTSGGTDQLAALVKAEAPKMTAVLADIAARAPRARIVVVGYPDMFPLSGGCWPAVPITDGDIAYLRGIELQLNAMLAADARTARATFVNTYTPTIGHDFCQPERIRDVEGLLPGSWALPFHPNARGQAAIAAAVLAAIRPA
jgi:lysophospholipase L1-like esterase